MGTPHDELFHFTFQHPRHAAGWMRSVLPPALAAAIDWTSLQPAPEKLHRETLRLQVTDLLSWARRVAAPAPIWLLAEHKSHRDGGVERQLLRYAVLLAEHAPEPGARPPVPVVAVLLHHGRRRFALRRPRPAGGVDWDALRPRLPFFVDDLALQDEADLRARGLSALATLTLLCLRFLRGSTPAQSLAAFDGWSDLLRGVDRDSGPPGGPEAVQRIGRYALRVTEIPADELHRTFERILQRPEKTIMSTAEKLKLEGLERGRIEGRAAVLALLLAEKFGPLPPAIAARIDSAPTADIEQWARRVLTASSLAGVFDAT